MSWTATNPVTIGNPTKKGDYDSLWDNADFIIGNLYLHNLGLVATVSSKALTVALKGSNGNDPSATNPVKIGFRSVTLTTGTPVFRTVTGALSVVLSSGSTLGFTNALAGRLYVWAIDNAGTVALGLSRTADIFSESNLISTTAEGGAGAADSTTVMYSTAALTNKAVRCIGYIEITTGATAGEWDNAPTKVQVMGPGTKRTGDIIQVVNYKTGEYASGAGNIPNDDTIPQKTEGNIWMTLSITPTSALNKLLIEGGGNVCNGASTLDIIALLQDDISDAIAADVLNSGNASYSSLGYINHYMIAGTTNAITFKYISGGPEGTAYFNNQGGAGSRGLGGIMDSFMKITEVFA